MDDRIESLPRLQPFRGTVGRALGVSDGRAYQLWRAGVFPDGVVVRIGGRLYVNPEAWAQFIADGGRGLDEARRGGR